MPNKKLSIDDILLHFPEASRELIRAHFTISRFSFHITSPRHTRLGSFKSGALFQPPLISINNDLKPHTFLLVFLHELAHYQVWKHKWRRVAPHGKEWKTAYRQLVYPFLQPHILPEPLIKELLKYFKTTPATFQNKPALLAMLAAADGVAPAITLNDIPANSHFELQNGKRFVKLELRRTRFKCYCPAERRYYLVSKTAHVIQISV